MKTLAASAMIAFFGYFWFFGFFGASAYATAAPASDTVAVAHYMPDNVVLPNTDPVTSQGASKEARVLSSVEKSAIGIR